MKYKENKDISSRPLSFPIPTEIELDEQEQK